MEMMLSLPCQMPSSIRHGNDSITGLLTDALCVNWDRILDEHNV